MIIKMKLFPRFLAVTILIFMSIYLPLDRLNSDDIPSNHLLSNGNECKPIKPSWWIILSIIVILTLELCVGFIICLNGKYYISLWKITICSTISIVSALILVAISYDKDYLHKQLDIGLIVMVWLINILTNYRKYLVFKSIHILVLISTIWLTIYTQMYRTNLKAPDHLTMILIIVDAAIGLAITIVMILFRWNFAYKIYCCIKCRTRLFMGGYILLISCLFIPIFYISLTPNEELCDYYLRLTIPWISLVQYIIVEANDQYKESVAVGIHDEMGFFTDDTE